MTEAERAKAAVEAQNAGTPQLTQTTVVISGEVEQTGETVSMDVPVTHAVGQPPAAIILGAFNKLKELGGIIVSAEPSSMDFIPAVKFKKLHFELKRVSLAL